MSNGDYDIHLKTEQFETMWDRAYEDSPYEEDEEELDKIVAEELAKKRRKKVKKKPIL